MLKAYAQARALLRASSWLVCLDEKTSLQAREGEQPPRPAHPVTGDCTSRCSGCLPMPAFLDQIEIWFSVLQRKHLQPNHFLSTKDLKRSLDEFIASHNQAAKPIKWTYTVEKLEQKLGNQL